MQLTFMALQILQRHYSGYLRQKILEKGIQCPDEDNFKIAYFLLGGDARKWWVIERGMRLHTWKSFKIIFDAQFCPDAYKETKTVKFERLV